MTFKLQAVCNGDTLKLAHPIDVPQDTPVHVLVFTDDEREAWLRAGDEHFTSAFGPNEGNGWAVDELRAFEATAYDESEPDYGTLNSLK